MDKFFENKFARFAFWVIFPAIVLWGGGFLLNFVTKFVVAAVIGPSKAGALFADSIFLTIRSVVYFAILSTAIYFIPREIFKVKITKDDLGIEKPLTWADLGFGIIGLIVALIFGGILMTLAQQIIPGFDIREAQELGFRSPTAPSHFIATFISLTFVPAFFEEFIFRGVIFGQLQKISPWLGALVVSVMFGAAHGQMNVGIATFAMSLVMCFTREKLTGSIWSGVVLHFLKNALAFFILYVFPTLTILNSR